MNELDYLRDEAEEAKAGMKDSCRQIGRTVKATAADAWRRHPVLVGAAAAGLAGLGVVWLLQGRQSRTAKTYVAEVETPRGPSLLARAGGMIGKMLFSVILAKVTSPPAEGDGLAEDLSGTEEAAA